MAQPQHEPKLYEPGVKPEALQGGPKLTSAGIIGGGLEPHMERVLAELGRYIHTGHSQTARTAVDTVTTYALDSDLAELSRTWQVTNAGRTMLDDPVPVSYTHLRAHET